MTSKRLKTELSKPINMKSSDLQIGSIVLDDYGQLKQIRENSLWLIYNDREFSQKHFEIPLTGNLFLKLGFIPIGNDMCIVFDIIRTLFFRKQGAEFICGIFSDNEFCPISRPIKYLHELQNICSALAGKHFDVKELAL